MTAKPSPKLSLVSDDIYQLDRKPETTAERVRRLQAEARMLAREEIERLEAAMTALAAQAAIVAEGGAAYPPGVREMASRMADDLAMKADSMAAIMDRLPEA